MARKNKKKKTLAFKNAVAGYLFIAPFIIGFILFLVVPLVLKNEFQYGRT